MLFVLLIAGSVPGRSVNRDQIKFDNGKVAVAFSKATGRFGISWGSDAGFDDAYGEVGLADGSSLKTTDYPRHDIVRTKQKDAFGAGVGYTVTHVGKPGAPKLVQRFWIYPGRAEIVVRLDVEGSSSVGATRIAPAVTDGVIRFKHSGPLQSLFVPYDNDNYFRFRSDAWSEPEASCEVGALYDDRTRQGLVVGSLDHDIWKSGVRFQRDGGVRAYSGMTSKYTHDRGGHGVVSGKQVQSARFVLGLYPDWRTGLERYGDLNALVQPPLPWNGPPPFGWNSWSGHKNKVNLPAMDAALDFVGHKLTLLRSGGTAYINFDSFWDNLTRDERVAFVRRVHTAGLKAGIYWTPFVNWGEPDWKSVGDFHFRDMQLKDEKGQLLPKLDGGWPLDPTHPGTLQRIDENLKDFVDQGFDYIKFDFMTHGALEAKHFDPKVQTGTAAYRAGMQRIVADLAPAKVGRPIFISLSIAPMFPQGFAHSRRISCDIFSNIGASEYFLNSQNYGWWEAGRLYRFSDPDSACEYQALGEPPTTEAEAITRFTASVIGGGMMIEGDNLTNPDAQARVLQIFSNRAALDLARRAPRFRPIEGNTGDKAGDTFLYREGDRTAYIAVFNFDKVSDKAMRLNFDRLGLAPGAWNATDLWTGDKRVASDEISFQLRPMQCSLVQLKRRQ